MSLHCEDDRHDYKDLTISSFRNELFELIFHVSSFITEIIARMLYFVI